MIGNYIVSTNTTMRWRGRGVRMIFTIIMDIEMPQEMFDFYVIEFAKQMGYTFKSASMRRKYLLFGSYIYKLKYT